MTPVAHATGVHLVRVEPAQDKAYLAEKLTLMCLPRKELGLRDGTQGKKMRKRERNNYGKDKNC